MEHDSGLPTNLARRKVHVVYYLNRGGGHLDHPHLIEGLLPPTQDGLHLKDFKNWLAVLRGKGMPDFFSWSYKRSYKGGYIWQDLSNDDLIHPLQKNEYVLMGHEIQIGRQGADACKCGLSKVQSNSGKRQSVKEDPKILHEEAMEYNSPSKASPKKAGLAGEAIKADEYLQSTLSSPRFKEENMVLMRAFSDWQLDAGMASDGVLFPAKPVVAMTSMPPLEQSSEVQKEVKVFKATEAEQTTDAATQTGESKRCSTEEALPLPVQLSSFLADAERLSSSPPLVDYNNNNIDIKGRVPTGAQDDSHNVSSAVSNKSEMFYSPSSVHSTVLETASPGSARSLRSINSTSSTRFSNNQLDQYHHSVAPPPKAKPCLSSQLVKQLLSCGTVDINESSILNLKSFSLQPPPSLSVGNTQHHHQHHKRQLHAMSPHVLHVAGVPDPSPPTARSWLCSPCGHSCFTVDNRSISAPYREGALKDAVIASSPESLASKRSSPFLHISAPLINLNCSSSPKTRSIGDAINNATKRSLQMGLQNFQPSIDPLISRSLSGGYREFSSPRRIQTEDNTGALVATHRPHIEHPCKKSIDTATLADALLISNSSISSAFKRNHGSRNGSVSSYSSDSNCASEDQRVLCREISPPSLYELVKLSGSKREAKVPIA